ncbi:MAG: cytochrome c biogenesis protein CcdA [Candidatus Woesebacteria bacterium]|jgi:cytochrome c-type biogenesis protein
MFEINIPIAFIAGLASFFAPCVVPLLPAYIGYVAGISVKDLKKRGALYRKRLLFSTLFYILGFSLVFVALGSVAAGFGRIFRSYDLLIQRVGGLLIILFGLEFLGYIHIPIYPRNNGINMPKWINKLGYVRSFFVGLIFATIWTPCVGPVLGSILSLAAVTATVSKGAILLFVYSLGISIPFLMVSLTLTWIPNYIKRINKYLGIISKVAGAFLILLGVLLLTDTYKYINAWVLKMASSIGIEFGTR